MQNHHACNGVAAVHERSWTFENFHGMNAFLIHFESVLVAPLLPFLTNTLVNDNDPVIAKTSDDRLRDACARAYLGKSGQVADGIDDVRANGCVQLFG